MPRMLILMFLIFISEHLGCSASFFSGSATARATASPDPPWTFAPRGTFCKNNLTYHPECFFEYQYPNGTGFCKLYSEEKYCSMGHARCKEGFCVYPPRAAFVFDSTIILLSAIGVIVFILCCVCVGCLIRCCVIDKKRRDLSKRKAARAAEIEMRKRGAREISPLDYQCCICIKSTPDSVVVPCGHVFCADCIDRRTRCPSCLEDISQAVHMRHDRKEHPFTETETIDFSLYKGRGPCSNCNKEVALSSAIVPCGHLVCDACCQSDLEHCPICPVSDGEHFAQVEIRWDTVLTHPLSPLPYIPDQVRWSRTKHHPNSKRRQKKPHQKHTKLEEHHEKE